MFREDAMDWLQNPTIGFPDQASVDKIDTHHHFVPKFYAKGVAWLSVQRVWWTLC